MKQLPDKLSELLALGLEDLKAFKRGKGNIVNMGTWLEVSGESCVACLAGSVMRRSLGVKQTAYPVYFSEKGKLWALDTLRHGYVDLACLQMGIVKPETCPSIIPVADYDLDGSAAWFRSMRKLIKLLQSHGL